MYIKKLTYIAYIMQLEDIIWWEVRLILLNIKLVYI